MRWIIKRHYDGEIRVVKKFLIFPRTIKKETRWWETVYIKQEYECGGGDCVWCDKEWVNPNSVSNVKEELKSMVGRTTNTIVNTVRLSTKVYLDE